MVSPWAWINTFIIVKYIEDNKNQNIKISLEHTHHPVLQSFPPPPNLSSCVYVLQKLLSVHCVTHQEMDFYLLRLFKWRIHLTKLNIDWSLSTTPSFRIDCLVPFKFDLSTYGKPSLDQKHFFTLKKKKSFYRGTRESFQLCSHGLPMRWTIVWKQRKLSGRI